MTLKQFLESRTWAAIFSYIICLIFIVNLLGLIFCIVTLQYKIVLAFVIIVIVQRPLLHRWPLFITFIKKIWKQTGMFRSYTKIYEGHIQEEGTMFTYTPHGVYAMMILANMNLGDDPLSRAPGLGSRLIFLFPFLSCLVAWWGLQSVDQDNMTRLMQKNSNLALIPGGFEELALTTKKAFRVYIKKRKGFIKMALKYGYKVAPVICFGENNFLHTLDWFQTIRLYIAKLKFPAVLPFSRFGLLPDFDTDIVTIVGNALQLPKIQKPNPADVKLWHNKYMDYITELYEKHKILNHSVPLELY